MRDLYLTVSKELSKVDFDSIWPGFRPYPFALVSGELVYLADKEISVSERPMWANTVIEFESGLLATWCLDSENGEIDAQVLAGNLVHEMFHAFQNEQGESRWANEFALMAYPDNLDAYRIKSAELRMLTLAYRNRDANAFASFTSLRQARRGLLGDIILQEYAAETFEGMAEYAGLSALAQLSQEKFDTSLNKWLNVLENPGEHFFNVRRMAYPTGAIICLTAKKLGINITHSLNETQPLFELLSSPDKIAPCFDAHFAAKKARFDEFLAAHNNVIEKNALICGFDPMNMWRLNDQVLCNHFVMLDDEHINGPVLLNMAPGSERQVVSIIK